MGKSTLMLFAPPRPPIRLSSGKEVVIGRHADCDITVVSAQASRRHARVLCTRKAVAVEDLGSTNGTFVNGERIDETHDLSPGDRIEVGDVQVTYCVVEAKSASPLAGAADQTLIAFRDEPEDTGEALEGDLVSIPIFAVLQMLEMGGSTGRLEVESGQATGQLWLESGRVVHATTEKDSGMDAALALARAEQGRFAFAPGGEPPETSFMASVTEVILESTRMMDEESA